MARELSVWLFDQRVGVLSLVDGRLSFQYSPDWLVQPGAVALSHALPLQAAAFDDRHARPFFAGLLPEGQLRRLIAQQFQVSTQNDFALLDHIGGECAGAVSLLAPGAPRPALEGDAGFRWLSDEALAHLLDELPQRPMMAGQDGLRLSLAGAQDKLPVVFDGVRVGLPLRGMPSSHILKPAIRRLEDTVSNEGFCMALAGAMQLNPAQTEVRSVLGRRFLLVARYDRVEDAQGQRQRLHQEDFCQALGVVPELKYQNEGGPDLPQCFELVRRLTRPSAPQVLRLLDAVVFNALIGNHDAHAKNFSVLYAGPSAVLAPLYDVLSTAIYPTLTPKMAMKLGSKYKFSEVQTQHWDQFADAAGLGKAPARKRIVALAKTLPTQARALQASPSFDGVAVVDQIVKLIDQRCALTIKRLEAA